MVRVMLVALLLVAAMAVVCVVVLATRPPRRRARPGQPSMSAPNSVWARYYADLAEAARCDGNEASAAEYDSLARTYSGLAGGDTR